MKKLASTNNRNKMKKTQQEKPPEKKTDKPLPQPPKPKAGNLDQMDYRRSPKELKLMG